jgi:hypothetical protein
MREGKRGTYGLIHQGLIAHEINGGVRRNCRSFGFQGVKEGGGNWGRRNMLTGGARVSERERRRGRGAGLV